MLSSKHLMLAAALHLGASGVVRGRISNADRWVATYSQREARRFPMTEPSAVVASLLPGIGTAALAVLSGAGGSALLDIWWKPRQARRKVAALLFMEMFFNTDYLLLHAYWREKKPLNIPDDFTLSMLGWEAAIADLKDLDVETMRAVHRLYNRYAELNNYVAKFGAVLDELRHLPPNSPQRPGLEGHRDAILDAFNSGVDVAIEDGKSVLPRLLKLSGLKEGKEPAEPNKDYAETVARMIAERDSRLQGIKALQGKQGPRNP